MISDCYEKHRHESIVKSMSSMRSHPSISIIKSRRAQRFFIRPGGRRAAAPWRFLGELDF
jgi:hypothetical protein